MTISVIGAGYGRTGTYSLKLALEQLGFGPCCHGLEDRHFRQGAAFWQSVFNREQIEWNEYFRGYRSTVDSPSCKFYLELAQIYPSAKIILTWRDSNTWFESYRETIFPMMTSVQGERYFSFLFGNTSTDRDSMIAAYERHNADVKRFIPPERLLVYEIKRGWQPLCEFLGVPVPDARFPSKNSRAEFPELIDGMLEKMTQSLG